MRYTVDVITLRQQQQAIQERLLQPEVNMRTPTVSPLRALRNRAHISLDELAFAIGINASTLSRAERGYRSLPRDTYSQAERICRGAIVNRAGGIATLNLGDD